MSWGENVSNAVEEVVASLAALETEWDTEKLGKKLREYFNKGAKNLKFKRREDLPALVNEYADNALSSLFAGLGDREWLYTGQGDFLLVVDAGIKDNFPAWILKNQDQLEFEQLVLGAYDRAFEEQRFCPILSDAVPQVVSGPKIKKKVWNSVEQGRKDAAQSDSFGDIEQFTKVWINQSIAHLSESSQGSPEATMEPDLCTKLFITLLEANALPLSLAAAELGAPVHVVEEAVAEAYTQHTVPEDPDWQPQPKKRQKHGAPGAFTAFGAPGAFSAFGASKQEGLW